MEGEGGGGEGRWREREVEGKGARSRLVCRQLWPASQSWSSSPPFALTHSSSPLCSLLLSTSKHARGDVAGAFRLELARVRCDVSALDQLVLEYALCRGLACLPPSSASAMQVDGEDDGGRGAAAGAPTTPTPTAAPPVWRGRPLNPWLSAASGSPDHHPGSEREGGGGAGPPLGSEREVQTAASSVARQAGKQAQHAKWRSTLELRALLWRAEGQLTDDVARQVAAVDPGLFEAHPGLLFDLRRSAFASLVQKGDVAAALALARTQLGPLAARHPSLLATLKATLLSLVRPPPASSAPSAASAAGLASAAPPAPPPSLDALCGALQAALAGSLGLEEPGLARVLRAALAAHADFFRRSRCADQFGVAAVRKDSDVCCRL